MSKSSRPRVAFCLECSIFAFGGTEVLVAKLVRQLAEDYEIVLVSDDDSIAGTWAAPMVCEHRRWQPGSSDPHALVADLKALRVDLAHFHLGGNYAWNVRRSAKCPIVIAQQSGLLCVSTNHGFFSGFEGYCAHYRPFLLKLALLPIAWAAKIRQLAAVKFEIAVSKNDYHWLRRWYFPLRHRFRQVYHAKLPAALPPAAILPRAKRIVCVGTIGPRKGQWFLVQAFAGLAKRYPDWHLELLGRAGDQESENTLNQAIIDAKLGDQFSWTVGLDDGAIADRLSSSEIFAMPSLHEGLGLSLQEALYYGCACVASRAGGITDLIEDNRTGLLVEPGEVPALQSALEKLIADPCLRARLRTDGAASIRDKKMSAPEMGDTYRAFYRSLLP